MSISKVLGCSIEDSFDSTVALFQKNNPVFSNSGFPSLDLWTQPFHHKVTITLFLFVQAKCFSQTLGNMVTSTFDWLDVQLCGGNEGARPPSSVNPRPVPLIELVFDRSRSVNKTSMLVHFGYSFPQMG